MRSICIEHDTMNSKVHWLLYFYLPLDICTQCCKVSQSYVDKVCINLLSVFQSSTFTLKSLQGLIDLAGPPFPLWKLTQQALILAQNQGRFLCIYNRKCEEVNILACQHFNNRSSFIRFQMQLHFITFKRLDLILMILECKLILCLGYIHLHTQYNSLNFLLIILVNFLMKVSFILLDFMQLVNFLWLSALWFDNKILVTWVLTHYYSTKHLVSVLLCLHQL